uniref:Uncharacterized protein n=1 Tax=Anguilla anguilla TaxID=7936 RepID=A0A0E9SH90_ANGAN
MLQVLFRELRKRNTDRW